MKRVMSGRKSRRFMGRLLAGMTAAAVFVSSFAVPGNEVRVYAKETKTGGAVSKEPEVTHLVDVAGILEFHGDRKSVV